MLQGTQASDGPALFVVLHMGRVEVVDGVHLLPQIFYRFTEMPCLHEGTVVRAVVKGEDAYWRLHEVCWELE
jgi:hypothetical protein